ncbi:MAG: hypothetical protein WCJ64_04760 [Rhodospirillaceae bacterium]
MTTFRIAREVGCTDRHIRTILKQERGRRADRLRREARDQRQQERTCL